MRVLWRAAFRFPTHEPGSVGKLAHAGWWVLLCPPVGWLMALGYRREVALNLVDERASVMPARPGLPAPLPGGVGRIPRRPVRAADAVGVVWSYLVIGFAVNNALVLSGRPGVEARFRDSVLLHPAVAASPNHPLRQAGAARRLFEQPRSFG